MQQIKLAFVTPRQDFIKELTELAGAFFPSIDLVDAGQAPDLLVSHQERVDFGRRHCQIDLSGLSCASCSNDETVQSEALAEKRLHKRQVKRALYQALKAATGIQPPWGSLTGIRPARLCAESMQRGLSLSQALAEMRDIFDVQPDKLGLLERVIRVRQGLPLAQEDEIDVYIGIPFCPSRCRYCSFISSEVGNGKLLAPYTAALIRELEAAIDLVSSRGLRVRAFYMGGGTPTALPADMLAEVLSAAQPLLNGTRERTVEAGRPDSIDQPKLLALKDHGIQRISINPQTMHDVTLACIGRAHTQAQTQAAFELARSMGFGHINMDIIAGLPGEPPMMFAQTLEWIKSLAPESLTVHTLAIKRSSDMHRWADNLPQAQDVERMAAMGLDSAYAMGMEPYYLYRQKHMAGNLENVGYAKSGLACLYNVDTMEDNVSILALGAGGISKFVSKGRLLVRRAANVKEIRHYIEHIDEMAARKQALFT